jgi:hypothetical protein
MLQWPTDMCVEDDAKMCSFVERENFKKQNPSETRVVVHDINLPRRGNSSFLVHSFIGIP